MVSTSQLCNDVVRNKVHCNNSDCGETFYLEFSGAIEWMTQPITQTIIKEFEEALPNVRQLIKTRSFRAKKEEEDLKAQRHGPRRGRGRGRTVGRPTAADTGNTYRDHRWRERAVKK